MPTGGYADAGYYESQRRNVNTDYAAQMAANTYSRFLSKQRGERDLGDMTRGFKREFPSFSASFGQRGLTGGGVNSGSMQRAMGNYIGDYNRQYSRSRQDLTGQLQQFDLQGAQLGAQRQNALRDIETQKAREIASRRRTSKR